MTNLSQSAEVTCMPSDAGRVLFEALRDGFEQASAVGIVQIISELPQLDFFITVNETEIDYSEGLTPSPSATITMRDNVIHDLVAKAEMYDSRVVEFSSRLSLAGDRTLANFLLNLVMRPAPSVVRTFKIASDLAKSHALDEVVRVNRPDLETLREAMDNFKPLLISGVLDEWGVENWNPKTLEAHFGRYQIVSFLPWTIRNYTTEGAMKYTGGMGLPGVLAQPFRAPPLLQDAAPLGFPLLWLGSAQSEKKSVTGLHCDYVNGFLCQVFGRKKVIMYAPDQEEYLYPKRAYNMYRSCWTGPDVVDYEKYPLFKHAKPIEFILNPGEVLFIPFGWYHCIFALDTVMSISYPVECVR
jgi:hypothetical protein